LSLALIQFEEGQVLSEWGIHYLKIFGANLHDENKISRASYSERIQ
jgi:DNA-directed RNA polymerase